MQELTEPLRELVHDLLDTIADLQRQLAERDADILEMATAASNGPTHAEAFKGGRYSAIREINKLLALKADADLSQWQETKAALDAYVQERVDQQMRELEHAALDVIEWENEYRTLNNLGKYPPSPFVRLAICASKRAKT